MRTLAGFAAAALVLTFVGGAATGQTKKETKPAPSPCAGLEQSVCKANTACAWYRETTTKKGQKRKAHCRKKPTPKAKK